MNYLVDEVLGRGLTVARGERREVDVDNAGN